MQDIKFINKTNNTVYLSMIDRTIPYLDDQVQNISVDEVKKSTGFRKLISIGKFFITECGNSLFERNLLKMQKRAKEIPVSDLTEEQSSSSNKVEVKIRGSFYEAGGYAKVNRNLAFGLSASGLKVQVEPLGKMSYGLNEQEAMLLGKLKEPVSNQAIVIDSIIPSMTNIASGVYRILYTTIEACTMPEQFVEIMNSYNEIWVTSNFCRDVIKKYDVKSPIKVIPASININLYNENVEPYEFQPALNDFIFLSVFNWSYRKGYDVLLRAYLEEFTGDENVSLLLRTSLPYDTGRNNPVKSEIQSFIEQYGGDNPPHLARCSRSFTDSEMPSVYKACDAFVLFSRGEEFCLPLAEASLCGLPVIATNHSGQTMFLNKDNAYLIDVDVIKKISPGLMKVHYWDNQEFPQLKSEQVIKDAKNMMRYVFENHESAKSHVQSLQMKLAEKYNMGSVAKIAGLRLINIWRTLK